MGEPILEKKQLEEIGVYVKNHMGQWLKEQNIFPFPLQSTGLDREILERIVRVEEGLKHQGETLEKMMIQSDKRFSAVDKRFDRLYVFLTGIFLTSLGGFVSFLIQHFS